jgi:bifunctional non-homologous end joining protein LigD
MRQPIFLGLREDKKPEEVRQEVFTKSLTLSKNNEFTNLDKIFWPKEGYTKGDVITYYDQVAPFILPYLADRPESLNRHPNGIESESFFQKDIIAAPKWVRTVAIRSDAEKKVIHWLLCNDKRTLLYMANLGCIEINPWSSRVKRKDFPDYLIIDLDPNGVSFKEVVTTAKTVKKIMDTLHIDSFVKTSGKTGLHILVPLGAKYTFDQTRKFAELLANVTSQALPYTTSVVRNPEKREKKVYIDFLQNRIGQTIAAPYSLRPVPGACVSTPLEWDEVRSSLLPTDFTIKNIGNRLEKKGDIWKKLLQHKGINMLLSLDLLQQSPLHF